jgi:transcription-repair coupling factor (superfamily II helicase)
MPNSLENLTGRLNKWKSFENIISSLKNGERIWVRGVYRTPLAFLLAGLNKKLKKTILAVFADEEEAQNISADIKEFNKQSGVYYLPSYNFPTASANICEETLNERISSLYSFLTDDSHPIVITSLKSFIRKMPSSESFLSSVTSFKVGEKKRTKLVEKLGELNYERGNIVEERGTWSLRGSILDVFTYFYDDPLRIEFSDEKIESIRHFDPTTQKSTGKVKEALIFPKEELQDKGRNSTILSYLPKNA